MATPRDNAYAAASGASVAAGRVLLASLVPSGSIMSVALNTRDSLDPKNDPLANPQYPNRPPWDVIGGTGWTHVTDYAGAVFASDLGLAGTYLQYCASGHSANGATCWVGFDVWSRRWRLFGRPLPVNNLWGYVNDAVPEPALFDHDWGDWIGDSSLIAPQFRQPGYNPPAGAHTRGSLAYRPASAAENVRGQVLMGLACTGVNPGTSANPAHYWDADTELFSRCTNQRPGTGSSAGNFLYHSATDYGVGWCFVASSDCTSVDLLDCSTMTWRRHSGLTNYPFAQVDAGQAFICGGLLVFCDQAAGQETFTLKAIRISELIAGTATAWTSLTLSGTTWPSKAGVTVSIAWQLCPLNGVFYAVNRVTGSQTLFKLTPPGSDDTTNLSGTWTLSSETLTGDGLVATTWHYNRLQWCPALKSFLFTGESMTGDTQAIRPIGV